MSGVGAKPLAVFALIYMCIPQIHVLGTLHSIDDYSSGMG